MRHYCTLFDSKYMPQGLALYESLAKHSSEPFTLDVLAMDEECFLQMPELPNVNVGSLATFEHMRPSMFACRQDRSWQEFCWTCGSNFADLLLQVKKQDITYLDADVFFFSDPEPVFREIGNRSIAITPHRLIPSKKHLEVNGQFNVGFVHFKNTPAGRQCLSTWARQTRERCSATVGCGDQQYLDEWPIQYRGDCHIIQNIGVNAAPWNIGNWAVTEGPRVGGVPIVLYHFHEYIHDVRWTNYALRIEDIGLIYKPYAAAVNAAKARLESLHLQA